MKKPFLFYLLPALLLAACSPKPGEVQMPASSIDVESLIDGIDYDMDVSGLSLADVRVLRHAPAARQGFPFRDAYLRAIYETTTWYDSLMWQFDGRVESVDWSLLEERKDEPWRDTYYRMCERLGMIKYTEQEQAFMKRLEQREKELLKLNFSAGEGLRVNVANMTNPQQLKDFDTLLAQRLGENGFAIVPAQKEQLIHIYEKNDYCDFPNFVTTDLYLQLFHLYFDCMLRDLEAERLLPLMQDFCRDLFAATDQMLSDMEQDARLRPLALHNAVYFSTAYQLLSGQAVGTDEVRLLAQREVERVMQAANAVNPFFLDYREVEFPYSLFRPRGHYTRSEALQRYFRGMMWLQTAPFGLDHRAELMEAVMLAYAMKGESRAMKRYDKLNSLITLLMGQPDNLSMLQVISEVEKTGRAMPALLADEQALDRLGRTLNDIGNRQTRLRPKFERTSHNKICLMPQRYQPDAEVLQEMVDYDGKPTRRATPRGLDVFAAMGVGAAERILKEEGLQWKGFQPMLDKMKQRMSQTDWSQTVATRWMDALRAMQQRDAKQQLPYFMATPQWDRKDLNAMLASWTELKHDAILYAKQPMGAECGGGGLPEPVVKGYVEPNVAFWRKAIELLDATERTLKEQQMMTEKTATSTTRLREEAEFLLRISEKELAGREPTDEEYDQLQYIGATFENISLQLISEPDQYLCGWTDVQGTDRRVSLVADVYTANADNNPAKSILCEAIGDADEIYVIVEIGGYLWLTRGAVFSYREFTQPIGQPRPTDEEWQQLLKQQPRRGVPQWMLPVIVPMKQTPEANEEVFYSSGC